MKTEKHICVGAGLICLDILIRGVDNDNPVSFSVGGTCGNVMTIMSHLGWDAYPVARLDNSHHTDLLMKDMQSHGVHVNHIIAGKGKTPVIIQRNIIDKDGLPIHRFEFKGSNGRMFLEFSPITLVQARNIINDIDFVPDVFFFDRVSPAFILLAKEFKTRGSLIYFEPSCKTTVPHFGDCVSLADIIKFSDQRIPDTSYFDSLPNTIIIQTLGDKGLRFRYNSRWIDLSPVHNQNVIDTVGAGDWTSAAFIYQLGNYSHQQIMESITIDDLKSILRKAQTIGSMSCSYDGARGMMKIPFPSIKESL